jgi:hypothetical protein
VRKYGAKERGVIAMVMWASSAFEGECSSEKCPATARNQAGREGPVGKGKGASWGGIFMLGLGTACLR